MRVFGIIKGVCTTISGIYEHDGEKVLKGLRKTAVNTALSLINPFDVETETEDDSSD